jgi:hypothetical protein
MYSSRRNDYDVTNTVRVSSAADVRDAVQALFAQVWPEAHFLPVARAFDDFEAAFMGHMPGYFGVDTVYHDQQHTLDVTLAMARLMAGYDSVHARTDKALGAERAAVGVCLALFHDIGYLREHRDRARNGAEYTRTHVARGARFMDRYLPSIGLAHWTRITGEVVHFTGYEKPMNVITAALNDARDVRLGHLLGTADIVAQMADRCYLEKCRDRLYPEFVLGDMALPLAANGGRHVRYASGLDLLRQTPDFMIEVRHKRLMKAFGSVFHYVEPLFNNHNPYIETIDKNLAYLSQVLRSESWRMLRRSPKVFVVQPDSLPNVRGLVNGYLEKALV